MSKDRKSRAKRKAKREAARKAAQAATPPEPVDQDGTDGGAVRPTLRQLAGGDYRLPVGPQRAERPALNLKPDCIAALMVEAPPLLTAEQHDAARDWQELRWALRADLGVSAGRSCLDIGPVGHDGGDGDPALAARWRKVRALLGPTKVALLDRTCVEGAWPRDMAAFRAALDAFAGVITGRLTASRKRA